MKTLTNVIIKNSKRRDKSRDTGTKEGMLSALAFAIVFFSLAITMLVISIFVTTKLIEIDQSYTLVNILFLMDFLILFTKGVFESLNVLYFSKDLRVLLRMPIKSINIVHSKMINMIISEYEMEIIMLAIPMIVYGILTNVSLIFYLYMTVILLVLPIIPIIVTSLVVAIIMRFTNKIKNKSKAMYATIIIAILVLGIITSFFSTSNYTQDIIFEEIVLEKEGIAMAIADGFSIIKPITNTMLNYNNIEGFKNLIVYLLENVFIYIAGIFLISKIYLKGAIGNIINGKKGKITNFERLTLKDFKENKKSKAYLSKEWKTINRTPIFFIQCIITPVIYPIMVFLVVMAFSIFAIRFEIDIWGELAIRAKTGAGTALFLAMGQVFYMMNFSSIIAVSRESNTAIMTKYIPISLNKQFSLKILLGTLINFVSTFIVTAFYYLCTNNLANTAIVLIILILLNRIGEKIKLLIDLSKPQITWTSEYTMMKQNTNVMYVLFYTLLIVGTLILVGWIVGNVEAFLISTLVITFIINKGISIYINDNEEKVFKNLY